MGMDGGDGHHTGIFSGQRDLRAIVFACVGDPPKGAAAPVVLVDDAVPG